MNRRFEPVMAKEFIYEIITHTFLFVSSVSFA